MLSAEYVAGFFDGEGCVNFTVRGKHRQTSLRVMIVNTDRTILEALQLQFGGRLPAGKPWGKGRNWKKFNRLIFVGREALNFLAVIRPFARVKKAQVELAFEFAEFMDRPRRERCDITREGNHLVLRRKPEVLVREAEFKEQMHTLNRKGEVLH